MIDSLNSPESYPRRCPLCGRDAGMEFFTPAGDIPCPSCGYLLLRAGQLLAKFQEMIGELLGVDPHQITAESPVLNKQLGFATGGDSLDAVELVMLLEEDPDINISGADPNDLRTVGDLVRFVLKQDPRTKG